MIEPGQPERGGDDGARLVDHDAAFGSCSGNKQLQRRLAHLLDPRGIDRERRGTERFRNLGVERRGSAPVADGGRAIIRVTSCDFARGLAGVEKGSGGGLKGV